MVYDMRELEREAIERLGEVKPYTVAYEFEKLGDGYEYDFVTWLQATWQQTFIYSAIYVAFIIFGGRYMAKRAPFDLRIPLALWSATLAVFSIMAAVRTVPEMIYTVTEYGLHHSACHPSCYYGVSGFWSILFILSKPLELGDTVFIVLRKQPLIFLHWYHHITVMIYSWMSYTDHTAPGRWFFVMNYTVHAFMYTYYTCRALRLRVPLWINMAITTMQTMQMVAGSGVLLYAYWLQRTGAFCQINDKNLIWGLIMYVSYFILFGNFFVRTYLRGGSRKASAGRANNLAVGDKIEVKETGPVLKEAINHMLKTVADIERSGFIKKSQ